MLQALIRSLAQLSDPRIRRVIWRSLLLSATLVVALWGLVWIILAYVELVPWGWFDWIIDLIGGFAALGLMIILLPAIIGIVSSFFLEEVARAVEDRYYPGIVPAREQGLGEAIVVGLRFFGVTILLNLLILPVYALPVINAFVFYGLNGYLIGREYFELAALRRLDAATTNRLRRAYRLRVGFAGVVIVFILYIPVVNLLVPVLATAFMVHIFENLHRSADIKSRKIS